MKKHIIKASLVFVILLIITMAIFDYYRVKNDKFPIFAVKMTKEGAAKEYWVGPLYYSSRVTKYNTFEKLSESHEVSFGPWFYKRLIKYNYNNIDQSIKFIPVLVLNCEKEKVFYFANGKTQFYKVCLDHLSISYQGKTKYFEQSIIKDNLSLKKVFNEADKLTKPSGRYEVYSYPNFNLTKCETIYKDGQNIDEIILSSKDVETSSLCAKESCSFTKTFKVVLIKGNMESEINHITVEQNNNGKFTTVSIKQEHMLNLVEGKNYNFSFVNPESKNIDNHNIEEIFEYLDIIKVEEAKDKEFINQNVCI